MAKRVQLDEVRPMLNDVNEAVSTAESVIDKVEDVAEVVPAVLETAVGATAETARKGVRAFQSPKTMALTLIIGGAILGAGAGVGGYFLLKKRLETKLRREFEENFERELDGMRTFYEKRTVKKQPFSTPEEAAKVLVNDAVEGVLAAQAAEALNEYEGEEPPPGIVEEDPREGVNHRVRYDKVNRKRDDHGRFVPVKDKEEGSPVQTVTEAQATEIRHNVFVENSASLGDWDQDQEEANRNPAVPYIISHDEFMENAYEHEQRVVTYYSGDDVLADEREQFLDDVEGLVGAENLKRFGHGSRDSSIVYVRNERKEIDFEVVLNRGTYAEEVVGLEHSDAPRMRHGRRDPRE